MCGGVEHGESDSATHGARWVLALIQAQETAGSASPGRKGPEVWEQRGDTTIHAGSRKIPVAGAGPMGRGCKWQRKQLDGQARRGMRTSAEAGESLQTQGA